MSEAAERVEAWRHAKRKAGYRPVVLWLPIAVKSELDALAYTRGQDLATCLADALHALAASQGTSKPLRLDARQLQALKDEVAADILRRLNAPETPPLSPQVPTPPPPAYVTNSASPGGKPGVPLETLAAIVAERQKHPDLSLAAFGQHLYATGVYRTTSRKGVSVPAEGGTVTNLLKKARLHGLLSGVAAPTPQTGGPP
jgi:hypothetical protein